MGAIIIQMKIILLLSLAVLAVFAGYCGGNCPGGKCPSCPCGTDKNPQNIEDWCSKHNWNQRCCKCIVSHESGGNANAMNHNRGGSTDVGLFQINSVKALSNLGQLEKL